MATEDNCTDIITSTDSTSYGYDAREAMITISSAQNSTNYAEIVTSMVTTLSTDIIHESSPSMRSFSPGVVIVLSVIVGVIILLTVGGNLLTIASFCTTLKIRTYSNHFILGLAIVDLLAGAFVMPVYAVIIITRRWPFGENFCDIFTFLDHFSSHVSILLVTLISLDRCVAVTYPLRHRRHWRRRSRAILIIAVSYVIPAIIWLFMIIFWKIIHRIDQRLILKDTCEPLYLSSVIASFISPVLYFLIPFTITAILCTRICIVIKTFYRGRKRMNFRMSEKMPSVVTIGQATNNETPDRKVAASVTFSTKSDKLSFKENNEEAENSIGDEKNKIAKESMKGVRTLVFIVTAMAIAWFPSVLVILTSSICDTCLPGGTYSVVVFWGYTNSLMNPACYALADKNFRDSFIRILSIPCQKKGASSSIYSGKSRI